MRGKYSKRAEAEASALGGRAPLCLSTQGILALLRTVQPMNPVALAGIVAQSESRIARGGPGPTAAAGAATAAASAAGSSAMTRGSSSA